MDGCVLPLGGSSVPGFRQVDTRQAVNDASIWAYSLHGKGDLGVSEGTGGFFERGQKAFFANQRTAPS